ncbi:hypothetical protein ABKU14_05470 [Enterobacter roggenkampii]|uniref:hypothetical protein n=1 Tax=Enterobacter roggenkampii TaxID=1812935 RepID=UPI0032AF0002
MDSVHHIWCPLSSQEFQDLPDGAETTLTIDLTDYEETIRQVVGTLFGNDFIEVSVETNCFTLTVNSTSSKIPHGILVNMGKRLAANLQSITCHAMRIYHVNGHPDARQLFHCFDADCL